MLCTMMEVFRLPCICIEKKALSAEKSKSSSYSAHFTQIFQKTKKRSLRKMRPNNDLIFPALFRLILNYLKN